MALYVRPHFHTIYYNGKDLADFGVHVSGDGTYSAPERDYEFVEIPGKSGDLLFDNGRYKNITVKYSAFILGDLETNLKAFRSFIMGSIGYHKIEDTYHPDEYRIGTVVGPIDPEIILLEGGNFDIEFNCKPQRYLKSGDNAISFAARSTAYDITSHTYQIAKPIFRAYGASGSFVIAHPDSGKTYTVTVGSHSTSSIGYIDIDSELGDCYYGATNCNPYITLSQNTFPVLAPGRNTIKVTGLSKVEVTPRWWEV